MKGFGSFVEVSTVWTFQDLMDAHEILDMQADAEREAQKRS